MKIRHMLGEFPRPESLAMPFAVVLGLEILVNRVLTRVSIFLPPATAGPMGAVAAAGSILMALAWLLGTAAILAIFVHENRPTIRTLAALLVAGYAFASTSTLGSVIAFGALAAASAYCALRPRPSPARFLLAAAVGVLAYAHGAGATGAPSTPVLFGVGEAMFLVALTVLSVPNVDRRRIWTLAVPWTAALLLAVGYARAPSLFAAMTLWSLGFALVAPPLFFLAAGVAGSGILGARARGNALAAASIALLLFAGIDVRISYVSAALLVSAWLQAGTSSPTAQPSREPNSNGRTFIRRALLRHRREASP